MIDRLLIQTGLRRDRVAAMDGDLLTELAVLPHDNALPVDSICLGRVRQVSKELDAAFIDLGSGDVGMLAARDAPGGRKRPIGARVHEGQALMVQLRRLARDDKGARLTARPQLAGRCLVYQPDGSEPQLSGRIAGQARRRRLNEMLAGLCPDGAGAFTARTAAADADDAALRAEAAALLARWQAIADKAEAVSAPALVWRPDPLQRVLATHLGPDIAEIVVSEQAALARLQGLLRDLGGDPLEPPRVHRGAATLFEQEGVEEQIGEARGIRVALPSGGWLAIEPTTALTAIDVNAGSAGAAPTAGRLALNTNLEAAAAIARQLRLRDAGGLVVIDFLRMHGRGESRRLMQAFEEALSQDRAETRVVGPSELGLVEMTRQRLGDGPAGESDAAVALDVALDAALAQAQAGGAHRFALHMPPAMLDGLGQRSHTLTEAFHARTGCSLELVADAGLGPEAVEVRTP